MDDRKECWPSVSNLSKDRTAARLLILRLFLGISLVAAAVTCAVVSLLMLQDGEASRFKSEYRTVTDGSVKIIAGSFNQLNIGIQELASIYSHNFPYAQDWPNVAWQGFNPTVELIGRSSVVDGMAFMPLIRPEQLANYEAFIKDYYATDPYFVPELYVPPYIPEGMVWSVNYSSVPPMPYHDNTGETSYGSPNTILTPTTQYTFSSLVGPGLSNFNIHSLETYGLAIDSTIDCVAGNNYTFAVKSCGALSDVMSLPFPEPGGPEVATEDMVAMFVHPIIPVRNQTELVGFAAGAFSWKALLSHVFPEYLRPLDIVVVTNTETFTFTTEDGMAKFTGHGDQHNGDFDEYALTFELLSHSAAVTSSAKYTITIYPTKKFATEFFTDRPMWAAVTLSLVFVYCAALFLSYDLLVQRESGRHEAVLDTKRRFVRFISHEIRTPLNTVRLGMKLLEVELAKLVAVLAVPGEGLLDQVRQNLSSWQHLADDIILNSETAVEVLNDLLNYDKIEMGTLRLEFAPVHICALLKKVTAIMQVQAQQKNIKMELTEGSAELIAAGRAMIVGDSTRVEQVIRSLISNALKFTPSDGLVTITVRTSSSTKLTLPQKALEAVPPSPTLMGHGTIVIAVKDSGTGLSEEDLAKISAEGVKFNANELQAGQGSGLGLFISKGIIEQHGGKLVVTSEGLGKGVMFSACLPYYDSNQEPKKLSKDTPSENTIRASICASSTSLPRRMLVVDDSPFNRKMLIRLLTSKDHKCEQAEDGEVAVRKYLEMEERGEPPDAILMDFEMPVMNGPSATARLRELGCACLIVGVTGNVLPHDVVYFLEHGANAVLPKPLILEDFEQLLYTPLPARPPLVGSPNVLPPLRVSVKEAANANCAANKVSPLENV